MGKKNIDYKMRHVASRGRKSKAGGGNQKRLNYLHPEEIRSVVTRSKLHNLKQFSSSSHVFSFDRLMRREWCPAVEVTMKQPIDGPTDK